MNSYENGCISVCIASFEPKCIRRFDFYHNLKIQLRTECALFILSNMSKYAQKSVELLIFRSFFTLHMIAFANDVNYKMFGVGCSFTKTAENMHNILVHYVCIWTICDILSSTNKEETRIWILCAIIDGCVCCVPVPVPVQVRTAQHILWIRWWIICASNWADELENRLELSRDPIIYLLWLQNRLLSSREWLWRFAM